jgi:hypothetical protein
MKYFTLVGVIVHIALSLFLLFAFGNGSFDILTWAKETKTTSLVLFLAFSLMSATIIFTDVK